jgi:hypothetical protein
MGSMIIMDSKNPEFVYKVVHRHRSETQLNKVVFISSSGAALTRLRLEYELNVETHAHPDTPGIFVFTKLHKATEFIRSFSFFWTDLYIMKCMYKGELTERKMLLHDDPAYLTVDSVKAFTASYKRILAIYNGHGLDNCTKYLAERLAGYTVNPYIHHISRAPAGTFTVSSITPISIVELSPEYPREC